MSKNMVVEYPHAMVINIQRFLIFHKNFARSGMGVADLDFPKGVEFSNSYQFFYIPSRNISCTQTFIRNLFTDHTTFCLNSLTNVSICDAIKSFGYRDA